MLFSSEESLEKGYVPSCFRFYPKIFWGVFHYGITLRETKTFASENRVSQKETDTDIPTHQFSGASC